MICTNLLGAPRISWGEPAGSGWEKHRMQIKPNGPGQVSGKCWVASLAPSQLDVGCHPCWWQKKTFLTGPCFRPNVLEEMSTARGGGQGVLPFSFHGGSVGGVCSPARFSPWPIPQSQGTGHVLGAEGDESPRVGLPGRLAKDQRTWGIQPEMYHLIVLESRSLRSRRGESQLLLRARRKALVFASFPAPGGFRLSLLSM